MIKYLIFLILLFNSLNYSQSENIMNEFEAKSHTLDTTTIPYRMFTPSIIDDQLYPLILTLHGSGERGEDNLKQIKYNSIALVWAEAKSQEEHPCFVVSPQCPKKNRWVDSNWDLDTFDFKSTPISNELITVYDLIEEIVDEHPIDRSRIYITGLSMGGFGTWYMLMKYPNLFAAAIPICGAGDPKMSCEISHIPIWDFHGDADKSVPVGGSRLMIEGLGKCGDEALLVPDPNSEEVLNNNKLINKIMKSDLIYTEYKGKGHSVWNESYQNNLVREWLFSKRLAPMM